MSQYSPGMIQRIGRQQFYLSTNQPTYAKPGVILEGILFRARFGLPMPQPSITVDRDTKRHKIDQCQANTEVTILRFLFVGNFYVADRPTSETSLIASILLVCFLPLILFLLVTCLRASARMIYFHDYSIHANRLRAL
jgi:hypothetical protein